jgi:hypothetical protein
MPGGGVMLAATTDINRIEASVTFKAYLMCAFAAFGGIFFGYDSRYVNGVMECAISFMNSLAFRTQHKMLRPLRRLTLSSLLGGSS